MPTSGNQPESIPLHREGGFVASSEKPGGRLLRSARMASRESLELNIIPLADVTFLLMIFFVIAGSFRFGEGILDARLPRVGAAADGAKVPLPFTPLTIRIRQSETGADDVQLAVDGAPRQPGSFRELPGVLVALRDRAGFDRELLVIIRVDPGVAWDHAVNALNAARRAGFRSVAFAQTGA